MLPVTLHASQLKKVHRVLVQTGHHIIEDEECSLVRKVQAHSRLLKQEVINFGALQTSINFESEINIFGESRRVGVCRSWCVTESFKDRKSLFFRFIKNISINCLNIKRE